MRHNTWLSSLICVLALGIPSVAFADESAAAVPTQAAPTQVAPPPPAQLPAPVASGATGARPAPPTTTSVTTPGQWVYTGQQGWLWMPYDQRFTYVDASAGVAQMYVYAPVVGWHWVSAPWVLGVGPAPFWGSLGPVRFGWYAHPWFHGGFVRDGWAGRPGHWGFVRARR